LYKIDSDNYRKIIEATLEDVNETLGGIIEKNVLISDVDDILQIINKQLIENEQLSQSIFSELRTITGLGMASIGLLALTVGPDPIKNESRLFPRDWLGSNERPNPDLVISHLLCNLSNYALSVDTLINKGLDTQARSQLRIFLELSWMTLNIISDKELFSGFVCSDEIEEKRFWAKNLKSFQLNSRLSDLEKLFELEPQLQSNISQLRKDNYSFYSSIVHHSYSATMLGALSFHANLETSSFNVFGEVGSNSSSTLGVLNDAIWYFLLMFYAILSKKHKISPVNPNVDFWVESFSLYKCVVNIYLYQRINKPANKAFKANS
jgi:hypothetical protein